MDENSNYQYFKTYHRPLTEYTPHEITNELDKRRDGHNRASSWEEANKAVGLRDHSDADLSGYLSALQLAHDHYQDQERDRK